MGESDPDTTTENEKRRIIKPNLQNMKPETGRWRTQIPKVISHNLVKK